MDLEQLESEIEHYFNANVALEIKSSPGTGKSEFIRYMQRKLSDRDGFEWGLGVAFLATYTPIDLMGYMVPQKVMIETLGEDGTVAQSERLRAVYTDPPWLYCEKGRPLNSYKRAIFFMDEYDKAEPDVKKTAAELMLHGAIGPHRLNKTVARVAASNRNKDRSGSTKGFDFVINRRGELDVTNSFNGWEKWALRAGLPPIFIMYAKKYASTVFSDGVPKEQGPWPTPRSYVMAVKFLMQRAQALASAGTPMGNYGVDDRLQRAIIEQELSGLIGPAASTELCTWLAMRNNTPDFADIVKDPVNTPVPSHVDAKFLTVYECAYNVNEATAAQVTRYMKRYPQEFHITFARAACRRQKTLLLNPAMEAFIGDNVALMNAIAA